MAYETMAAFVAGIFSGVSLTYGGAMVGDWMRRRRWRAEDQEYVDKRSQYQADIQRHLMGELMRRRYGKRQEWLQ